MKRRRLVKQNIQIATVNATHPANASKVQNPSIPSFPQQPYPLAQGGFFPPQNPYNQPPLPQNPYIQYPPPQHPPPQYPPPQNLPPQNQYIQYNPAGISPPNINHTAIFYEKTTVVALDSSNMYFKETHCKICNQIFAPNIETRILGCEHGFHGKCIYENFMMQGQITCFVCGRPA